jgi:hypothetical protein
MEFIKVRKKPVELEAFQLKEHHFVSFYQAFKKYTIVDALEYISKYLGFSNVRIHNDYTMTIDTPEGKMKAQVDDWIIKGVNGEIYPCKPNIFEKTYEVIQNE